MSKATRLYNYTVYDLTKDQDFQRWVCSTSSNCSSGGGGAVTTVNGQSGNVELGLQEITNQGNITTNALQIAGLDNADTTLSSMLLALTGSSGLIQLFGQAQNPGIQFSGDMGEVQILVGPGASSVIFTYPATLTDLAASFQGRVNGSDATQANDFVTLGQVQTVSMTTPNVVTQANTVNLVSGTYYSYNGTGDSTFTLPAIGTAVGSRIGIINMSSDDIILNSNSGGNDIFDSGSLSNTATILSGTARILYDNSAKWIFLT